MNNNEQLQHGEQPAHSPVPANGKHSNHGYVTPNGHPHYQQWLPAQFTHLSLNHYHPSAPYYPAPLPGLPAAHAPTLPPFQPGVGGSHHPLPEFPQRGWGGMQLQDQRGGRGAPWRGATHQPSRGRGGRGGVNGGGGVRGKGRGRGGHNGYSARWQGGGCGGGGCGVDAVDDLVWRVKRVPPNQSVDQVAMQGLQYMDSRGLASLMKELGKAGLAHRGFELLDLIRSLDPSHQLASLLDEFTYTSCISNCVGKQDLSKALALVEEMRSRGIQRNVHTYSALMNVCIKCGQYKLALEVYRDMRQEGCPANVVTYNTLIDVYGKSGQWEQALGVLKQMQAERIHPVTRTYNTLMIACNTSSQWQESLRLYQAMVGHGLQPNTTTYNALISAYSKAGDLARVLQTFREMVQKGCERSVITYSSLISACEKAGEWKLALQLFEEMQQEGCIPNVITYNSLITACAQGAQWQRAAEVYEQMQGAGCRPDVVTYTALIQAYDRGRQWGRALQAFEEMRGSGCRPDAIVFTAIMDTLWETGLGWAQRRAAGLYQLALEEGLLRRHSHQCAESAELSLHSTSAGVALLTLHSWLQDLLSQAQAHTRLQEGPEGREGDGLGGGQVSPLPLPPRVGLVAGKGKGGREVGAHTSIKESVYALLKSLKSPFKESADSTPFIGRLEASGAQMTQWLLDTGAEILDSIVPPAPLSPQASGDGGYDAQERSNNNEGGAKAVEASEGGSSGDGGGELVLPPPSSSHRAPPPSEFSGRLADANDQGMAGGGPGWEEEGIQEESDTDARVAEAFATIKYFEETHCLNLQVMPYTYLQQRSQLVSLACQLGATLALPDEAVYDAVLLMDRVMSVPLKLGEGLLGASMAACLELAAQQSPLPEGMAPSLASFCQATGLPADLIAQVQESILSALGSDTAALSALRCLRLYLERIGGGAATPLKLLKSSRCPFRLLHETMLDSDFLNYRPSVVAAAVLFVDRKSRGLVPFWPTALAALTGYSLGATAELMAAVATAQRVYEKMQVPPSLWNYQPSAPQPITSAAHASSTAPPFTSPHGLSSLGGSFLGAPQPLPCFHTPSSPHSLPSRDGSDMGTGGGGLSRALSLSMRRASSAMAGGGSGGGDGSQPIPFPLHGSGTVSDPLQGRYQIRPSTDNAEGGLGPGGAGDLAIAHSLPQGGADLLAQVGGDLELGADPRSQACSL